VDVQTHDGRGTNHQAYLWQYGTPGRATVFDFRMSRGREGPAHFLDKFEGILQTDAYTAYDRGVGGVNIVHACCWAHYPESSFIWSHCQGAAQKLLQVSISASLTPDNEP
jgi:hypothetical protein